MKIIKTTVEDMVVSMDDKVDALVGYSVRGTTDTDRDILLADVMANNHPALDLEAHEDLGTPSLEEAKEIADMIAARMAA